MADTTRHQGTVAPPNKWGGYTTRFLCDAPYALEADAASAGEVTCIACLGLMAAAPERFPDMDRRAHEAAADARALWPSQQPPGV